MNKTAVQLIPRWLDWLSRTRRPSQFRFAEKSDRQKLEHYELLEGMDILVAAQVDHSKCAPDLRIFLVSSGYIAPKVASRVLISRPEKYPS